MFGATGLTLGLPFGVTTSALSGFDDPSLGTRAFDYDFDASRLTTHTPDVERIQANAGLAGPALSGGPSNQEPALVTTDAIPGASLDLAGTVAQVFSVAMSSQWDVLHKSGVNLYFLAKPNAANTNNYVISTVSNSSSTQGMFLRNEAVSGDDRYSLHVHNGTDDVFGVTRVDSPHLFPPDIRHLVGVHYDDTGVQFSKDGVYIGSNTAVVTAYGTGAATATDVGFLNWSSPQTFWVFGGIAERFTVYLANKHSATQVLAFKNLVNSTYGIAL